MVSGVTQFMPEHPSSHLAIKMVSNGGEMVLGISLFRMMEMDIEVA